MAGHSADSPGRATVRQGIILLTTMALAGLVMATSSVSEPPVAAALDPLGAVAIPDEVAAVDGGRGAERAAGMEALSLLSFPWQERLRGWKIEFLPETEGLYGLTIVSEKRIEIYVRPERGRAFLAHVISHELGHAIDVTFNSKEDRRRWQEQRGIASDPWWPENRATDFDSGAGDFAESFAVWQTGAADYRGRLAEAPTGEDLTLLADLAGG